MPYAFGAYEFLAYVIPGGLLLFFLMVLFPGVKVPFGQEPVNVGGLVVFLVTAFVFGQILQTAATYLVQTPMEFFGYAYRTSNVIWKDQTLLTPEERNRLIKAVGEDFKFSSDKFGFQKARAIKDENVRAQLERDWRNLIRRIHSKVNLEHTSDRLEIYSQHFNLNLGLSMALIVMFVIAKTVWATKLRRKVKFRVLELPGSVRHIVVAGLLISIVIFIMRVSYFDHLFAEELFRAYLQSKSAESPALLL